MCFRRSFRDQVLGSLANLHTDMEILKGLIRYDIGVDMAANDDLREVLANQQEAQTELGGLPAKIDELLAQVGDQVDPELLAQVKAGSAALAGIVPNATPDPEPTPDPETPAEPVDDGGNL